MLFTTSLETYSFVFVYCIIEGFWYFVCINKCWLRFKLYEQVCKFGVYCRRERDHSEAERAQHIQQLHDLQEHIQEKERQLIELQEQVCLFACISYFSIVLSYIYIFSLCG